MNTKNVVLGAVLLIAGVVIGVTWGKASAQKEIVDAPGFNDASVGLGSAMLKMPVANAAKVLGNVPEALAISAFAEMVKLDVSASVGVIAEMMKYPDTIVRAAHMLIDEMMALKAIGSQAVVDFTQVLAKQIAPLNASMLETLLREMKAYSLIKVYDLTAELSSVARVVNDLRASLNLGLIKDNGI